MNTNANVRVSAIKPKSYYADSNGENVFVKEKIKANPLHYLIGAGIIAGIVFYISKRYD